MRVKDGFPTAACSYISLCSQFPYLGVNTCWKFISCFEVLSLQFMSWEQREAWILLLFNFYCCFTVEVSPDGAEGLRGALRFPSCSHPVDQPGASAPLPPVWDLVRRWEHERYGIYPLLPSHLSLLPPSCSWLCRQVNHQHMQDQFTAIQRIQMYIDESRSRLVKSHSGASSSRDLGVLKQWKALKNWATL